MTAIGRDRRATRGWTASTARTFGRSLGAMALVAFTLGGVSAARADDGGPTPAERARAQQLFESALADVTAGHHAAACPKFAASQAADPKTTTLLNLGACYESSGRLASAWSSFREAEALARKTGRSDLETAARTSAEAIAPRLVKLTIVVPESHQARGLVVSLDGSKLSAAEWGSAIPVDDGSHEIVAEAPGHVRWRSPVVVQGKNQSLEVPKLAAVEPPPAARASSSQVAPAESWWTTLRTTGAVVGGAGAAGVVTGLVLAFVAKSNYDEARGQCRADDDCPGSAVRSSERARSLASGGTVAITIGAVVGAAGAGLLLFAPAPKRSERSVGVTVGPSSLGVGGRF